MQDQQRVLEPYVDRFFETVVQVFRDRDKEFAGQFYRALFPSYRVERGTIDRAEAVLGSLAEGELPHLQRTIREANDELGRALRCRSIAGIVS